MSSNPLSTSHEPYQVCEKSPKKNAALGRWNSRNSNRYGNTTSFRVQFPGCQLHLIHLPWASHLSSHLAHLEYLSHEVIGATNYKNNTLSSIINMRIHRNKKFLIFAISTMRISIVFHTNIHLSKTIVSNNSSVRKTFYGLLIMIQRHGSLPFRVSSDLILPVPNRMEKQEARGIGVCLYLWQTFHDTTPCSITFVKSGPL